MNALAAFAFHFAAPQRQCLRRFGLLRLRAVRPVREQAQLVTGFAIGETDAVYARSGENAMLCAKDGETVYMIIAQADEQTLYALGVDAETK